MSLNNKTIDNNSHKRKNSKFMQWCWRTQKTTRGSSSWKKIKILQTNADTHNKKRESLSPEDKELFDKNHSAAQSKHHKSFSPDQRDQVLKKDAAKHKKTKKVSLSWTKISNQVNQCSCTQKTIWNASPREKIMTHGGKDERHRHRTQAEIKMNLF